MKNIVNITLVVEAIDNVKTAALAAKNEGDFSKYSELMENLIALENCLITEVKKELKAS